MDRQREAFRHCQLANTKWDWAAQEGFLSRAPFGIGGIEEEISRNDIRHRLLLDRTSYVSFILVTGMIKVVIRLIMAPE